MASSFWAALAARLDPRREPGRPLVTFYDDATGERTELSATTYANWVAKSAGVLVDDLGLDAGDRLRIELPTHWLGPVFLGAAWTAGIEVVTGPADVTVTGPDPAASVSGRRLLCALLPFAVASREPVPAGALDFGTLWPGQPDAFLGLPGGADDPAYDGVPQSALLARPPSDDRVLTDLVPSSAGGIDLVLSTLLGDGSVVWVAGANVPGSAWSARAVAERTTRTLLVGDQPPRS